MDGNLGIYPIYSLWKMVEKAYEGKGAAVVSGVDVVYKGDRYYSTLATFSEGILTGVKTDTGISRDPYVSSLFFLKEGPIISRLIYGEKIDLLFVNGHGICHPYNYGLATVVGFTHRMPTIGLARRLAKGDYDRIVSEDPGLSYITQDGKITGVEVKGAGRKRALYLSQGFGITIERLMVEYLKWAPIGRIPEPLRLAHIEARKAARTCPPPLTANS